MENASKALIIAGAILISIVLVSVGVIVVNSLNPDQAVSEMTQQEVNTFNSKFNNSTGDNRLGSVAKTLISTVMTNNAAAGTDTSNQVAITFAEGSLTASTDASALSAARNKIVNSARYDITVTETHANGKVKTITITKK